MNMQTVLKILIRIKTRKQFESWLYYLLKLEENSNFKINIQYALLNSKFCLDNEAPYIKRA